MHQNLEGFRVLENKLLDVHGEEAIALLARLAKLNDLTVPAHSRAAGGIVEKTAHFGDMLGYLLSVSHLFNELDERPGRSEKGASYALFGGYGVLSHLVARHGEGVIARWRMSPDLDILAWNPGEAEGQLRAHFGTSKRRSEKAYHKLSFNISDPAAQVPCEIDFYPPSNGTIFVGGAEIGPNIHRRVVGLDVLGVTVKSLALDDLLRLKLGVRGGLRPKDESDVVNLLSLYAYEGYSPETMVGEGGSLFPDEQRRVADLLTRSLQDRTMGLTAVDKGVVGKTQRFARSYLKAFEKADPYKGR